MRKVWGSSQENFLLVSSVDGSFFSTQIHSSDQSRKLQHISADIHLCIAPPKAKDTRAHFNWAWGNIEYLVSFCWKLSTKPTKGNGETNTSAHAIMPQLQRESSFSTHFFSQVLHCKLLKLNYYSSPLAAENIPLLFNWNKHFYWLLLALVCALPHFHLNSDCAPSELTGSASSSTSGYG